MEDKNLKSSRSFDYQERWHGWGSPVGLGLFFLSVAGSLFLLSAGLGLFLTDIPQPPEGS
jgi:hypothetical protein